MLFLLLSQLCVFAFAARERCTLPDCVTDSCSPGRDRVSFREDNREYCSPLSTEFNDYCADPILSLMTNEELVLKKLEKSNHQSLLYTGLLQKAVVMAVETAFTKTMTSFAKNGPISLLQMKDLYQCSVEKEELNREIRRRNVRSAEKKCSELNSVLSLSTHVAGSLVATSVLPINVDLIKDNLASMNEELFPVAGKLIGDVFDFLKTNVIVAPIFGCYIGLLKGFGFDSNDISAIMESHLWTAFTYYAISFKNNLLLNIENIQNRRLMARRRPLSTGGLLMSAVVGEPDIIPSQGNLLNSIAAKNLRSIFFLLFLYFLTKMVHTNIMEV